MKKIKIILLFPSILFFLFFFINNNLYSQGGFGVSPSGTTPHASAGLDIDFNNKGMLIPRVSLSSTTDTSTISAPATYLTVYNTNATMTGGNGAGMYYYNGSHWVNMATAANGPGSTGQVLTSQGSNQSPTWAAVPSLASSGSGGGFCACFNNFKIFAGTGSSGTWTVPTGITAIKVQVWGAGGGGAGCGTSFGYEGCGGGGGGGYAEGVYVVTAGDVYNALIGAGGAGGASSGYNAGAAGGPSSFVGTGVNIAAIGGSGGGAAISGSGGLGGLGGMGSGGYFNTTLGTGGTGGWFNGSSSYLLASHGSTGTGNGNGGGGGGGIGGGNGGGGPYAAGAGQNAMANSGAGGGGGYYGGAGGNGADGMIVVYW